MSRIGEATVTVILPYYVARALASAAGREAKNKRRQMVLHPFEPQPGKTDMRAGRAEMLETGEAMVRAAIDIAVDDWKKAHAHG